jgi:nucleoside-diphosphate-sugar epimerase
MISPNILITGAKGFIGSNLVEWANHKSINVFEGRRSTLNLYNGKDVEQYINDNHISTIIHTAIEGGMRSEEDSPDVFYHNLLMFENLIKPLSYQHLFINLASGAEFDRRLNINNIDEEMIRHRTPVDYYGLSKNIISKRLRNLNPRSVYESGGAYFNLRLFSCFNYNEDDSRMIKSSIRKYIRGEPIVIHQDKYVDFFYFKDFTNVLDKILRNWPEINVRDMNVVYNDKAKLSDVANIINDLSDHKTPIIFEQEGRGLSYTGNGGKLNYMKFNFIGLEQGIKECYDNLLHQHRS